MALGFLLPPTPQTGRLVARGIPAQQGNLAAAVPAEVAQTIRSTAHSAVGAPAPPLAEAALKPELAPELRAAVMPLAAALRCPRLATLKLVR